VGDSLRLSLRSIPIADATSITRISPPDPLADYRFVLNGSLQSSELRTTTTSFALGMAGVLLWFTPIPMQKASAKLELDLVLKDRHTNEVIWAKRIDESLRRYFNMHTGPAILLAFRGA
jgi:hypothetical protein